MKKQGTSTGWAYMLLSMMLIGFALTLIGCGSKKTLTKTEYKTEYLIKEVHDTLWLERLVYIIDSTRQATSTHERDCTIIRQDAQGNVLGTDRWHSKETNKELSHTKEKFDSVAYYRSVVDSLRRIKTDSVYINKVVEKELSLWNRAKIQFGGWAFLIVAAVIIYLIWFIRSKDKLNI